MFRAYVNSERCRLCGVCMAVCPEVFERAANHSARAHPRAFPEDSRTALYAQYAAEDCPFHAIAIIECDALVEAGR